MSSRTEADDLRYRLIKQGFLLSHQTFSGLARKLGVTPPMITHVARNRRNSKRVRRAIARALGTSIKDLWK